MKYFLCQKQKFYYFTFEKRQGCGSRYRPTSFTLRVIQFNLPILFYRQKHIVPYVSRVLYVHFMRFWPVALPPLPWRRQPMVHIILFSEEKLFEIYRHYIISRSIVRSFRNFVRPCIRSRSFDNNRWNRQQSPATLSVHFKRRRNGLHRNGLRIRKRGHVEKPKWSYGRALNIIFWRFGILAANLYKDKHQISIISKPNYLLATSLCFFHDFTFVGFFLFYWISLPERHYRVLKIIIILRAIYGTQFNLKFNNNRHSTKFPKHNYSFILLLRYIWIIFL